MYKVRHKTNNKEYASKEILKEKAEMDGMSKFLATEVMLLMRTDCPQVIRLYFYFEDPYRVYLLMELAKDGNLYTYIRKKGRITETEAINVN